ncbi:MAG: 30S ribosomal protein S17 [Chloroflexi bacterium]|nr:MAG: 30S ribosomal protein S17 [Chloroflexota bacterium]
MAEKTEKTEKTEKKTTAKTSTRAKASAKAPTATRAVKAPAKAAVAARPVAKRTVARKRTAPAVTPGVVEQWTWRRLRRKTKVGVVVSAKMAKTIIVEVGRQREHPLYKKVIRVRKRFATHDETGDAKAGDLVRIQESRPFSATKRWRLVEVISRAGEAGAAAPRVADIEKALEAAEGVDVILAPEREEKEAEEEQAKE